MRVGWGGGGVEYCERLIGVRANPEGYESNRDMVLGGSSSGGFSAKDQELVPDEIHPQPWEFYLRLLNFAGPY